MGLGFAPIICDGVVVRINDRGRLCVAGNDLTPPAARAIGIDDIGHVTLPLEP